MQRNLTEWMLIKMDALRYTREEAERMPVRRMKHFIGFQQAEKEERERRMEKRKRQREYENFVN
jgi:hypothetical protein